MRTAAAANRETVSSPQIWNATELESRATWRQFLPRDVGDEFRRFCCANAGWDLGAFELDRCALPLLTAFADNVRATLLAGDGIIWIRDVDGLGLDSSAQRLLYLALGSAIGEPMAKYPCLSEAADRGGCALKQTIQDSPTGTPTGFHTDSSRRGYIPDFVGLFCENPGARSNESLVSNALRAHQVLRRTTPAALEILCRPLVSDLVTHGVEKTPDQRLRNRYPVFGPSGRPEGLLFRYMRSWIERGQQKAGNPLGEAELAALDALDAVLAAPDHVVSFRLRKGDIVWINNRTLAHNRTSHRHVPGRARHLQRMWVRVRPGHGSN